MLPNDLATGLAVFANSTIRATNGSTIIGDQNGIVVTDAGGAPGGTIADNTISLNGSHVTGLSGSGIVVHGTSLIDSTTVTVANGSTVTGGNGVVAEAVDGGVLNFNVAASSLHGDLRADGTSQLNAALSNNASITGAMTNVTSVALDAATWNMTGNSTVGRLDLGSGTVSLGNGTTFNTLNVAGNFSGNGGTLAFNTALAGDTAATDKLIIGGDTSGSANVRVNNVGGAGAQTDKGIELIRVGGASNGQFNLAGRAVGGQYEYFLFKGTGADGNWYLRSQLPTAPDPCDTDPTLPECNPVNPEPVLRPEGGAYLANLQAAQTMFRLGYHDRHAGQNGGRAWARVDGSRTGFDAVSQQLDVQGNSQSLSVGADVWRNDAGSGVGVMLSSGNATSTSTNALTGYYARGKVKGEALGVYGTWRAGNAVDPYAGFYVDGSVQRAQFRNRVEGVGLDAERYDSRGWQGAIETGYAFRVGGAQAGGIFLEPQLQVGYNRWDDLRHTEANGTVVTTQDADGLYGRVGLRLSGVTRWGDGAADVQPYIAANWLHTRAESQVWMDDERVDARIPRSRAEVSAGASLKFANGFGAWAGLARQQASGYHQTSAQLGMSYSW
ncbi:autotransporter outer membrane beta-barrel domain-containing protein [Stenotrophomonas rhizophila]|uniref:autotransporter family protein n=1 Tax=Stenotrophomonas rhizophila TaxID=216778 RepID=UPI000456B6EE|nr:autotransporter outer membrane beta-barrel domain-containing protein [Stenotrophomonas rhizophila]AHY59013.1 serine protease [Stenotrophomonas rhizophila]